MAANDVRKIYYRRSLLDSTLFAVDADGEVISHMIYDAWGEPQTETKLDANYAGIDNLNNFTGYTYDETLNLYFAQNCFYNPKTHRFTQEDPIKDGGNWYAYCYNRPTTLADYFGLEGNPTDKILKMSNQYSYYSVRDIFDSNGQVGGIVMATGKSSYVCSVQYGGKMLLVEFDISKYYGKTGTYQTQATVSMLESIYVPNGKTTALGPVNIKYNASAYRTAINLSELQKYFAKVWCPTVESIANKEEAAKGFRFVGFGVQLELDSNIGSVGCELVFYTNDIQQDDAYQIYVYGGGGLSQDLKGAIAALANNPGILLGNGTISRFEGSAAVFAIWGNEYFRHAKDYRGSFNSASVTVNHAKGYVSWSDKCLVAGAGISTSLFSASVGRTYYDLMSDGEFLDIGPLKAQTKNIAQKISMPEL